MISIIFWSQRRKFELLLIFAGRKHLSLTSNFFLVMAGACRSLHRLAARLRPQQRPCAHERQKPHPGHRSKRRMSFACSRHHVGRAQLSTWLSIHTAVCLVRLHVKDVCVCETCVYGSIYKKAVLCAGARAGDLMHVGYYKGSK